MKKTAPTRGEQDALNTARGAALNLHHRQNGVRADDGASEKPAKPKRVHRTGLGRAPPPDYVELRDHRGGRFDIFDEYLRENEVAETLHKTRRTLRGWRQQRIGPPWVKPTRDLILYHKVGFRDWLKAIEVGSISGRDAG